MKILFIGNSHTFVHYVPLRVKAFLEKHDQKADVVMLSFPGVGLDYHLEMSQTYFNLIYGDYDFVVLQHNAHPFPGKRSLIDSGTKIAALCPPKTKICLYMTWSEKNNREGQKQMSEAYEQLAAKINAMIAPVGTYWWKMIDSYPEEMYFEDGEHTSIFGAGVAAAVIGRTLLEMPMDTEDIYLDAKELSKLEQDPRMIDLCMIDDKLELK